jgi:hypothetical protein
VTLIFTKIKTYHIEAVVVAVVLIATVLVSGRQVKEWVGALAVFFTFMHAQVADRMAEKQASMVEPSVTCYPFLTRYYAAKEFLWILYFALSQTWSALAGGVIFLLYPFWRKYRRSRQG